MRIYWLWEFFRDILYRRVGWQKNLIPTLEKIPGAYNIILGPLFIIIERRIEK